MGYKDKLPADQKKMRTAEDKLLSSYFGKWCSTWNIFFSPSYSSQYCRFPKEISH
jgi:hypothetical protein